MPDRSHYIRRSKLFEYATIGTTSIEGIAAVVAGLMTGNVALISLGFDSGDRADLWSDTRWERPE